MLLRQLAKYASQIAQFSEEPESIISAGIRLESWRTVAVIF